MVMKVYEILGLSVNNGSGYKYRCGGDKYIAIDDDGHAITQSCAVTEYVLHVISDENNRYDIRLSQQHAASFSDRPCTYGVMEVIQSDYHIVDSYTTYVPVMPLFVNSNFEMDSDECDANDDMKTCLCDDAHTCVFTYSRIGGDECEPCGYVYVNMDLFEVR